jgi:hypothetical protein
VDTSADARPARHPYRVAILVVIGLVALGVLAAAALYLWLGKYAPLSAEGSFAPGPGLASPAGAPGGKASFTPRGERETFDTAFTLSNTGRFAVTLASLAQNGGKAPAPLELLGTDSATASADPGHLHSFSELRIAPGDSAILVVRWKVGCADGTGSAQAVRLRYDYLKLFHRSQTVTLPFAVRVRCGRTPTP